MHHKTTKTRYRDGEEIREGRGAVLCGKLKVSRRDGGRRRRRRGWWESQSRRSRRRKKKRWMKKH